MGRLETLIHHLIAAVSSDRVVTGGERLAEYRGVAWGLATARMALPHGPGSPGVAVLPSCTDDVVAVVRCARASGTPIVPYGAGTGVHAGAAPLEGAILLDLGQMDRVLDLSVEDRVARTQPGVILGDLDRAAAPLGYMVGHDPWSQPIATVGGAVSTNGVGYLAGKYGSMGDQVLGLEVVLGTGQVVRMRSVPKSSTGPLLRHLFIGGEGLFGIITEVDVRLFPLPERRAFAGYVFPRFEDGLDAVMDMLAIQLRPSLIDYEEESAGRRSAVGELIDAPSEMYLAFEGFREEVEAQVARAEGICLAQGGDPMAEDDLREFWDTRHESAERYMQQRKRGQRAREGRTTSSHLNVGLPVSAIQPFRRRAARELAPYRLALRGSGIWGMPELFSVRFEHQAPGDPGAPEETEAGTDLGLRIVQELGGSMEYCHGVGLRLAHLMDSELGAGLDALRQIKRALDPDGVLNPGKLGI